MSSETFQSVLLEEQADAGSRRTDIGRPPEGRTHFACRHPVWTFLLAPVPSWVVLVVGYVVMLVGVCHMLESLKEIPWALSLAGILFAGAAYVPAAVLTLAVGWLAMRSGARLGWWLTAALLLAVASSLQAVTFRMPTEPGTGSLNIGLGFPPQLAHWPQFVVPLAITAVMIAIASRKTGTKSSAGAG